jgi:hypothetical protein
MRNSTFSAAIAAFFRAFQHLPHGFKRRRRFDLRATFLALMMLTVARKVRSYVDVLREMTKAFGETLEWSKVPSPSALSKARSKLPVETCRGIWQEVQAATRQQMGEQELMFGELRPIAIDGTHVLTPHDASTITRFGQPNNGKGKSSHYPQSMLLLAVELFTRVPVGAAALHHKTTERVGMKLLLDSLGTGTLSIMDRGFVGKRMLREVLEEGGHVLLRMTTADANRWDCVGRFLRSEEREATVNITLPSRNGLEEPEREITVRLIRRSFRRGRPRKGQKRETMVLLTTLLDPVRYPVDQLVALYSERWGIETFNRELKTIFSLEAFHCHTADRVEQEIYAALTWLTIAAAMEYGSMKIMRAQRGAQPWNDPRRWQIRRTLLFTMVDEWFGKVMAGTVLPSHLLAGMGEDLAYLVRHAARRRPDRSYLRKRKRPWGRFRAKGGYAK